MAQEVIRDEVQWANPGALGLAAFGLNTILLQVHNVGLIDGTLPLVFGFFWGGVAQVIAGIIDARRGDAFGLTAFVSYGVFWISLGFAFLLQWTGTVKLQNEGLAWLFVMWGIFTGYMTLGTFKANWVLVFVFVSLTVLFFLLAAHFFGAIPAIVPGIEGLFCGGAATYGSAAIMLHEKYGRWVLPVGLLS
ncbi:MAG: acetate uptake transporter [Chloroflexota bacterium]